MISVIFFLSTLFLTQGLTAQSALDTLNGDARIVGGSDAKDNEYPFMASIKFQSIGHICGGSIITNRCILTAAHCLDKTKPEDLKVVVGTNSITSGGTVYKVAKSVMHKDYNTKTLIHDIAILTLSKTIVMTSRVKTVLYATSIIGGGKSVYAIGWGYTAWPTKGGFPDKLKKVSLLTLTAPNCQKAHKGRGDLGNAVWDGQVCTKTKGSKGICPGDSGGPLIDSDGRLVGLSSWVVPCGVGPPDVFTRVSKYSAWIKANSKL